MKSFSLFGKKKQAKSAPVSLASLPTSRHHSSVSMSSSSSSSSLSSNDVPGTPGSYEMRGIFRTLEAAWYHRIVSNNREDWMAFDDYTCAQLEGAYNSTHQCTLSGANGVTSTVVFDTHTKRSRFGKSKMLPPIGHTLVLGRDVRRTIEPVWWYEHDTSDGQKMMCRFDVRNQVRLEALSDGRHRLKLTDAAFAQSFTIVLDPQELHAQVQHEERLCGFMYLHHQHHVGLYPHGKYNNPILGTNPNSSLMPPMLSPPLLTRRLSM